MEEIKQSGHTLFRLPGLQSQFVLDDAPDPASHLRNLVLALVRDPNGLLALNAEGERLQADRRFSTEGRAAELVPLRTKFLDRVGRVQTTASIEAQKAVTAQTRLFQAPQLEPGDIVGRLDDADIRTWFESTSMEQFNIQVQQLSQTEQERIVVALARSPVPGRGRDYGLTIWSHKIEQDNPQEVARVRLAVEDAKWAGDMLKRMADVADLVGAHVALIQAA
jgi:hypothetical protein